MTTSPSRSPCTRVRCAPRPRTSSSRPTASRPSRGRSRSRTWPRRSAARSSACSARTSEPSNCWGRSPVRTSPIGSIDADRLGDVVVPSRSITHPEYPDAVIRTPTMIKVRESEEVYTDECFGPVSFLIMTASIEEALTVFGRTMAERGAMTAARLQHRRRSDQGRARACPAGRRLAEREPDRDRSTSTSRRPSPTSTAPAPIRPPTPATPISPSSPTASTWCRAADWPEPSVGQPAAVRSPFARVSGSTVRPLSTSPGGRRRRPTCSRSARRPPLPSRSQKAMNSRASRSPRTTN